MKVRDQLVVAFILCVLPFFILGNPGHGKRNLAADLMISGGVIAGCFGLAKKYTTRRGITYNDQS